MRYTRRVPIVRLCATLHKFAGRARFNHGYSSGRPRLIAASVPLIWIAVVIIYVSELYVESMCHSG